jgi:hypothetical protein
MLVGFRWQASPISASHVISETIVSLNVRTAHTVHGYFVHKSVVDKGTLGRVFLRVLVLFSVCIIPSVFHAHSFIDHRRYQIQ